MRVGQTGPTCQIARRSRVRRAQCVLRLSPSNAIPRRARRGDYRRRSELHFNSAVDGPFVGQRLVPGLVATGSIAEAAAVSPATLFRYFPTKEDILFYADDLTPPLVAAFRQRLAVERPFEAFRQAIAEVFPSVASNRGDMLVLLTLVYSTPSLRAHGWLEVRRCWLARSQIGLVARGPARHSTVGGCNDRRHIQGPARLGRAERRGRSSRTRHFRTTAA
jgi:AcrR family transcriptional regulator